MFLAPTKPQSKAVCIRVLTVSPKKPNSANRKVVKARITCDGSIATIRIVGEGHHLQQHATILVRNGQTRDLIGVKHHAIRSKYDLAGVSRRKSSRSKYGVKSVK